MTRGLRWLVGGVVAALLLLVALFLGFLGGIWGLVGGVGTEAVSRLPTGVVTEVDETGRDVTVRYVADDGAERVDEAPWSSDGVLPDVGDVVDVTFSPTDPTDVVRVSEDPRPTTRFFRDAGIGLLVVAGVLGLLAVAVLVATAVWSARAPRRPAPARIGG